MIIQVQVQVINYIFFEDIFLSYLLVSRYAVGSGSGVGHATCPNYPIG